MVGCAVDSCRKRQFKGSGIHFFSFPSDPKQKSIWIERINRTDFEPSVHSRVCSLHFEDSCFEKNPAVLKSIDWKLDRPKIKQDAVPTICLPEVGKSITEVKNLSKNVFGNERNLVARPINSTNHKNLKRKSDGLHRKKKQKCEVCESYFKPFRYVNRILNHFDFDFNRQGEMHSTFSLRLVGACGGFLLQGGEYGALFIRKTD